MRRAWSLGIALVSIASSAHAQTGRELVERVASAMGGTRRVMGMKTLTLRGTGENYNFGQNRTPDSELPMFAVTKFVRVMDFANSRWRQDQTREPRFVTANTAPQRQRTGFDVVAYDITSDTSMRRLGVRPTIERRSELIFHPIGFIRAALDPAAKLEELAPRAEVRRLRLDVDGERYTMSVDTHTMLPLQIERMIPHAMLGDVPLVSEFPKWYTASDIRVPIQIIQRIEGRWVVSKLELDGVKVDGDIVDITAPETIKTDPLIPVTINVTADSLAPGVWLLGGGSHHSVLIEMNDHLILVEAPQSDLRTLPVIQKARTLRPNKPLRTLINTHHHFDHAGGVRAAMAEGLTVITQNGNKAFFDGLSRRRFSIEPDRLSKSPRSATVEGVTDKRRIADGNRVVDLYEIRGSIHSGSILMVHLPAEKLLIEADLYTPPAVPTPMPFAANLLENIQNRKLEVERIVPVHGRVVPFTDLQTAAGSAAR
jgi:glyoxylase-like metal-dependent hydrolase (beta-lactamase superfamily II)